MFDADKTRMIGLLYGEQVALLSQRQRAVSYLSVVSFRASIVQYVERSFFTISYFDFKFTSTHNSILFVVFGVTSSFAVIHTTHGQPCVQCETALGRSRTVP